MSPLFYAVGGSGKVLKIGQAWPIKTFAAAKVQKKMTYANISAFFYSKMH